MVIMSEDEIIDIKAAFKELQEMINDQGRKMTAMLEILQDVTMIAVKTADRVINLEKLKGKIVIEKVVADKGEEN